MDEKNWSVYILECNDGSFYTGATINIKRRVWEHNNKIGAKSIRGKLPVKLVYIENYNSKTDAFKREREIKGWNREKKIKLIKSETPLENRACPEE